MTEVQTNKTNGGNMQIVAVIIAIAIVAFGGYYFFGQKGSGGSASSSANVVDSSKYQAIFLTNGQVYFGKASNENANYVNISDVYYMILKKPLQNQQKDGEEQAQEQAKPEYSLVKLGKEMHGPTSMSISRDQILFIENLADDSKVVSTIKGNQQ